MRRRLSDFPLGRRIFIDSNIFVYHFSGISVECREFLKRCASGQIEGITSTVIILETCHRLMLIEAANRFGKRKNMVSYLRSHPDLVQALSKYREDLRKAISGMRIRVVKVGSEAVLKAMEIQEEEGFLTNDSLCISVMEREEINKLATNDTDFDRVESLHIRMPKDIP